MLAYAPSLHGLGLFALAALILAFTPGPGMLYVVARTLAGGRRAGIASALGTALGGMVHVLVATVGLSALLATSARAFMAVKYGGAAYLLFLGVRALRTARHARAPGGVDAVGPRRAFAEGVLTEALNVKTALFFLAFIPQFIDHARAVAPQFAVLGSLCVLLNTGADFLAIVLAAKLAVRLRNSPRSARHLQYCSGSVLVGLGAYLAASD